MMQEIETRQPGQTESFDSFKPVDCGKKEGKYLAFTLDKEDYGIRILKVREIIGMMPITNVPQTPDFVLGVINLRGKVIPVVDLRVRFGMRSNERNDRTCIVVVEFAQGAGAIPMGIVVDSVSEVFHIKESDIESTPSFGVKINTDFILGMAKMGNSIKILLDIDRVLSAQDLEGIV
ncbi:MAG: chemotaxis protein CheW [Desulfobacterales bacterium]|jgi:purine-binding chemotaxis protein CheW|nr:chemotaxis protein CheW [Desulfobacterales bacterium]MDD4463060.1 chemotaxis protein CheW [Desulfobacterales bacterium]